MVINDDDGGAPELANYIDLKRKKKEQTLLYK